MEGEVSGRGILSIRDGLVIERQFRSKGDELRMIKNEMDENVKHLVFGVCIAFVMLGAFAGVSVALAIYMPDNYAKIQWAIDNASAGDTIIVRDGTYYENLKVDKQLYARMCR